MEQNEFIKNLPPELQQKIQLLPPEKQDEVIGKLMGKANLVPIEAERNETITTPEGGKPEVAGGYLKKLSTNPISGENTYEIPDDVYSEKHTTPGKKGGGGVDMFLPEGAVVNSDKTKIEIDFKINKKNFKGKTIKEASDYLARHEKELQDTHLQNIKDGKVDNVTEASLNMMLAKASHSRKYLNDLQDVMLEQKSVREQNDSQPLLKRKADSGLNVSLDRFKNFSQKINDAHKDGIIGIDQIRAIANQTGILNQHHQFDLTSYTPGASQTIDDFKGKIAAKESGGYKNPYMAVAGIPEHEATSSSFKELEGKAASSAIGKYQFLWNKWQKPIQKVTGINDPDEFRKNPEAQEKFMDWYSENELLPKAIELKQKYLLPMDNYQVMAMLHLEGAGRLEKRLKSGDLDTQTMANNFQNSSPSQYAQGFKWGGKIKAKGGTNVLYDKALQNLGNSSLTIDDLRFLHEGFNSPEARDSQGVGSVTDVMTNLFGKQIPLSDAQSLGLYNYQNPGLAGNDTKGGMYDINSNIIPEYVHQKWAAKSDSYNKAIGNILDYYDQQNPNSPSGIGTTDGQLYHGFDQMNNSNQDYSNLNPNDLNRQLRASRYDDNSLFNADDINKQHSQQDQSTSTVQQDGASWADKLKYGLREAAPYLSALKKWNEKIIPPVLQQKPYDNPYDNISTDVNIQSALNDIDRTTLTAMEDSTGNPSVRNARIAQMIANTYPAKGQLYTEKYNQEKQLENNKTLGQGQYRNQWTDTNMALRKRYEEEWLKTLEVQRQQRSMAEDYMTNVGLRKAEQEQAIKLGLLNTPYDYNKFSGDFTLNPQKQKEEFMLKQLESNINAGTASKGDSELAKKLGYEYIKGKWYKPVDKANKDKFGGRAKKLLNNVSY